jgi:hypothetical protein
MPHNVIGPHEAWQYGSYPVSHDVEERKNVCSVFRSAGSPVERFDERLALRVWLLPAITKVEDVPLRNGCAVSYFWRYAYL